MFKSGVELLRKPAAHRTPERLRRTKNKMKTTKQQIRAVLAAKRKALNFQWQEDASADIIEKFLIQDVFKSAKIIGLYKAISGEVSLEPLFSSCWNLGKQTCIPVFNASSQIYEMAEITESTDFRAGHYGIQEPISPSIIPLEQIDLIIVPGVAFDLLGNRLGRGGGYYDRMLDKYNGIAAAVAYDFQIIPLVPTDPHDKPVNYIITETKFVKV